MINQVDPNILYTVERYYTAKVREHGATPKGVDWRDLAGQHERFRQLMCHVDGSTSFSIGEVGCGYGALVHYMKGEGFDFSYVGCDVSTEMIVAAQSIHHSMAQAKFVVAPELPDPVDYVVASGVFNVKLEFTQEVWLPYVLSTIEGMRSKAKKAVIVNFLTSFSDEERRKNHLWYPDPGVLLNELLRSFGFGVSLCHNYSLYEFTVIVRGATRDG